MATTPRNAALRVTPFRVASIAAIPNHRPPWFAVFATASPDVGRGSAAAWRFAGDHAVLLRRSVRAATPTNAILRTEGKAVARETSAANRRTPPVRIADGGNGVLRLPLGEMQRRIFGIETEFGVTCTFHGQRRLSPDEVARYLFRRVVSWGRSSNVFLRNGSRLYLDVGTHPEYATAECDDLAQLVTHDKAGERILEDLLVDAERRLADEGIGGDIFLFKNNTDSAGNSYGCHENYLVARAGEFSRIADVLLPVPGHPPAHLRRGQGAADPARRGATASRQRAEHIWEGVSSATTRSPADHQHPRRAARRRRALPAAARHRRRLEHGRGDDAAQGRRRRPRAAR